MRLFIANILSERYEKYALSYPNLYTISTNTMAELFLRVLPAGWPREYVSRLSVFIYYNVVTIPSVNLHTDCAVAQKKRQEKESFE